MSVTYPDITAGILVGGRGTRLDGADKARLRTNKGITFIESTFAKLAGTVAQVVLLGRSDQSFPEIDAPLWLDTHTDAGPIGGLETLLSRANSTWCLLLACDMPGWQLQLLDDVASMRSSQLDVVIPRSTGGWEPTSALYRTSLAAHVSDQVNRGSYGLQRLVEGTRHAVLDVTDHSDWTNVNWPSDLQGVQSRQ